MSEVILRDEFLGYWSQENAFDCVNKVEGEIAKAKDNRRVIKFQLNGATYYLKHHVGVGWQEIIKNFLQLKKPVLGASNEWLAIERLKNVDIETMEAVAFGQRGKNPAQQESFLVTRELKNTTTLEQVCDTWRTNPPSYALKKTLVERVALIARNMHLNGLNHRDFYLCHILLDTSVGINNIDLKNMRIFLVDLHRMQMRAQVPHRWIVKDIGSIYFSAMDAGLTRRDVYRFMHIYTAKPLREELHKNKKFWQQVQQRANRLYQQNWKKNPNDLFER